ncbi:MAG: DNA polymerase III subunit gamma/tau [Syntrophobacteraceae bacterium]
MTYLVIARKWRPQTFEDVVGQPHVTRTIQNAIRLGRVAHAYLFTGARGVGKTSVARIFSKALNCEHGPGPVPCNECSNCREITQGNSVDVLEIDGASNRGIDNIRELRETVRYRPAKSRYKIYIIDEVHMLTTEAFNALLKTLEEPPEHVLFLFATTEPHKIPSTILSRCQRFDFRRISTQQTVDHLADIARREGAGLSEAVIYAVAREADGSMRDAQSLMEQLLAFSGDGLSDEEILDVLGVVDRRSVHRVAEAVLAGDVRTCVDVVSDLHRRGIDSRRFCQQLCDHFRNLLLVALGADGGGALDIPESEREMLKRSTAGTTAESLYLCFQMILKAEEEIRRSTLPKIALEMLLLRLTQLPRLETIDGVLDTLRRIEGRLGEGLPGAAAALQPAVRKPVARESAVAPQSPRPETRHPDEAREPAAPSPAAREPSRPAGPFVPEETAARWPAFLAQLRDGDPVLAAKLTGSRIVGASETGVEMEVLEVYQDTFKEPQALAKLTAAAAAYFGVELSWTLRGRSTMDERDDGQEAKRSRSQARRTIMEHPVVLQALEILGGELLEVKVRKPDRKNQSRDGTDPGASAPLE